MYLYRIYSALGLFCDYLIPLQLWFEENKRLQYNWISFILLISWYCRDNLSVAELCPRFRERLPHLCLSSSYRPPTKLREGNVFFRVCLSVHRGVPRWPVPMMHWTSQPPPPLVTSGGHHWRPVQTCSLEDSPNLYWHLVAKACTVGKRAVCIPLECFRVYVLCCYGSRQRTMNVTWYFCRST